MISVGTKQEEITKLFNAILKRQPNQNEINRYMGVSTQEIIDDLKYCVEKCKNLQANSGERLKTNIKYDEQDIKDFFSTNKYKIAICLSGHLRDYDTNLSSIEKFLIKPLNADVFMHTWDSIGKQVVVTRSVVGPVPNEQQKLPDTFSNLISNIKAIEIQNNNDFINSIENHINNKEYYLYGMPLGNDHYGGQAEPKYIYSQLYSINRSFKLLEDYSVNNNIKYDIVIKLRSDYQVVSGIFINELDSVIDKNVLYVPTLPYSNHGHPICCLCENNIEHEEHIEDVCDVFAYSNYEVMKKYMNIYEDLDSIRENQIKHNNLLQNSKNKIVSIHKYKENYNLVDIWKDNNYASSCFYPERFIKQVFKNTKLIGSKLSGKVNR